MTDFNHFGKNRSTILFFLFVWLIVARFIVEIYKLSSFAYDSNTCGSFSLKCLKEYFYYDYEPHVVSILFIPFCILLFILIVSIAVCPENGKRGRKQTNRR